MRQVRTQQIRDAYSERHRHSKGHHEGKREQLHTDAADCQANLCVWQQARHNHSHLVQPHLKTQHGACGKAVLQVLVPVLQSNRLLLSSQAST